MRRFFATFVTICVFGLFFLTKSVFAADIGVDIDLTYSVRKNGSMHIREEHTVSNYSNRYFIPASSQETFVIRAFKTRGKTLQKDLERISKTIELYDESGTALQPKIEIKEEYIEVTEEFGTTVGRGQNKTFVLEYDNFELAGKSGAVWNIYVPGLPEDFDKLAVSEGGASVQNSYKVVLEFDKSLGTPNFLLPEPQTTDTTNGKNVYTFDPKDLIDRSVWVQIGEKQYYTFKIKQPVVVTANTPSSRVFNTWYDLLLPRESENQTVYFKSISPKPAYIRVDDEGDVIARFVFSEEGTYEIVVTGYIVTNITEEIQRNEVGTLDDIDLDQLYGEVDEKQMTYADLLLPQEYWEVDSEEIQLQASKLMKDLNNVYDILISDYNYVTQTVDYDNLKIGILNKRQGALNTLKGGSSVCMEYSDLFTTILRAQGIPARAAFGYGFDHRSRDASQEGHQWVEVYLPNVGWVAVDPTWGDTGRKSYIGGDVDHALWYVAGASVNIPSPVVKYAVDNTSEVDPPDFEVDVVEKIDSEPLTSLNDLLDNYPYTQKHKLFEKIEQLNTYGKLIFIGIPSAIVVVLTIIIVLSFIKLVQRVFFRDEQEGPYSNERSYPPDQVPQPRSDP